MTRGPTFRHLAPLMDRVPYRHADAMRGLLGSGRLLVDLGGGTGRVVHRVRPRFARVLVVDVEPRMLRRARARGFDAVVADARHLPLRAGVADAVMAVDAFHHFPDQADVLRESDRILARPSGRLVVEEFDPSSVTGRLVVLFEALARFGSRFHRPRDLARLVAESTALVPRVERFDGRDYAVVGEPTGEKPIKS